MTSSRAEDVRAVGRVLSFIWTFRSRVLGDLEQDLVSKMTAEDTTMTASDAEAHFALWSSAKRMNFQGYLFVIFLSLGGQLKIRP